MNEWQRRFVSRAELKAETWIEPRPHDVLGEPCAAIEVDTIRSLHLYSDSMPHALASWLLRLVLALCLVVSGMSVGASQPAGDSAAVAVAEVPGDLPCHSAAPPDDDAPPCDCCPQRSCDSTICAFVGCLPAVAHLPAAPPVAAPILGRLAAAPSAPREPPFRPPIV
ncbi:MAG TPA: hypothetical protein VM555_06365 [Tahibacter sp.]|nr:hypothetical protein [Tahibacter sp.]